MVYLMTLSVAETTDHQMVGWWVNNGLWRMWEEVAVAWSEALSLYYLERTEENRKKKAEQNEDSWSVGYHLNTSPTEYDAGVLITQSGCLAYKDYWWKWRLQLLHFFTSWYWFI